MKAISCYVTDYLSDLAYNEKINKLNRRKLYAFNTATLKAAFWNGLIHFGFNSPSIGR